MKDGRLSAFFKLLTGNSVAQVASLLFYPYIARLYSPEDFSNYGFIFSTVAVLSVFATGQFHLAFLNPTDESEVNKLIGVSTVCSLIFTAVFAFYVLVFVPHLWVMPIYLLLYSLFDIQRMVFIRKKAFTETLYAQSTYRIFGNLFKLAPPMVAVKSLGMVLSEIVSLVMVLSYGVFKKTFRFSFDLATFKKYRHFPLFQTFSMATSIVINDFPVLLWTTLHDKTFIGYYVLGQRLLIIPCQVLANAIQNSSIHHLLESQHLRREITKLFLGLLGLGLTASLAFLFIGEDLLALFLGKKWSMEGDVFKLMALLFPTKFMIVSSQALLVLKNKTGLVLMTRLLQLGVVSLTLVAGMDFYQSLTLFILTDVIFDIILTTVAIKLVFSSNSIRS